MLVKRIAIVFLVIAPILVGVVSLMEFGWTPATLSLDAKIEDGTLIVQGETNLPEKTIIAYEVIASDDETFGRLGPYATGIAFVEDGKYRLQLDATPFLPGTIEVWVRLLIGPGAVSQPAELIARFGPRGERLKGKNIIIYGPFKRIELVKILTVEDNQ